MKFIKELSRFDLPGNYRSDYHNNDYMPEMSAENLKMIINKINELVKAINELTGLKNKTENLTCAPD